MNDHTPTAGGNTPVDRASSSIHDPNATPPSYYYRSAMRRAVVDRLRPGDGVGDLIIIRFLAAGGMGEVYEAEQGGGLRRRVIVKVVRGQVTEVAQVRFVREGELQAGAGAGLHHQGILPVYAAGQDGDRVFLVLPFVHGASLREVLQAVRGAVVEGRPPDVSALVAALATEKDRDFSRPWLLLASPAQKVPRADAVPGRVTLPDAYYRWAAARLVEAGRALDAAHNAGVLHLDVTPANMLVEAGTDRIRVCDFGVGVRFDPETNDPVPCEPLGVQWYIAPEKVTGRTADRRADVFGLGAILHEMITLRKPGENGASRAPADLQAIARKASAPEKADRYPTAAAFADDVQRWLDRRPTAARWSAWALPRAFGLWFRRNLVWSLPGLLLLVALAGLVVTTAALERTEAAAEKHRLERVNAETARDRDQVEAARLLAEQERDGVTRERDRITRDRKFEQDLIVAEGPLRDQPRRATWSDDVKANFAGLLRLRPDADLRDRATAMLDGLDATTAYRHKIAASPSNIQSGPAQVVFSPDGVKVVAAAFWKTGLPLRPATLWDGKADSKPTPTTLPGRGPVAFPDADSPLQLLAGAAPHEALLLWNVGTNAAVLAIKLDPQLVVGALGLSPDARFAAAVLSDARGVQKTVLWELDRENRAVKKMAGQWEEKCDVLAFSPDGEFVASGLNAGGVVIRSTADAREVFRIPEGELPVTALAFGPNFRHPSGDRASDRHPLGNWRIAVGGHGGGLSVWDLRARTRANAFYGSMHGVFAVAFNPDGTLLVSGDGAVPQLWDVATGRPLLRLQADTDSDLDLVLGIDFSPKGNDIAIGRPAVKGAGGLSVSRFENGRGVRTCRGLTGVVQKVWLSRSGKYVAALAQNWQFGVWERATGRVKFVWDLPGGWNENHSSADFDAADAEVLFVAGERAMKWSLKDGRRTGNWRLPVGFDDAIVARRDQNPLLARREEVTDEKGRYEFRVRELLPDEKINNLHPLPIHGSAVTTLTPDGVFSADVKTADGGYEMHWFDGVTGERKVIPFETGRSGRVVPSGQAVIVGVPQSERCRVLRMSDAKPLAEYPQGIMAVSDSGQTGVGIRDDALALYRAGKAKPLIRFDPRRPPAERALGISPDGKTVFWGRADGTVCVADVDACLEQLTPFGPRE